MTADPDTALRELREGIAADWKPQLDAIESALAATASPGLACQEVVWDGPYRMKCGRTVVDGECGRHGKVANASPGLDEPKWQVRFWSRVNMGLGDGCWEWTGSTVTGGYGALSIDNRTHRAHRLSFEMFYGPIPDDMFVCHHCDNRACVRPDHLFLGTAEDNNADRDRKDRFVSPRGEGHGSAKLTWPIVAEIRASYEPTETLARRYGVDGHTIRDVRQGRTWLAADRQTPEGWTLKDVRE